MLHPIPIAGPRISNRSLPQGVIGILRHPTTQPHPGSILHISGFVALYELLLGIEAHFELWRKFFALFPAIEEVPYLKWVVPKFGV